MSWNPGKYMQFGDERTRPSVDLASRVLIDVPRTVIDLGCGPGNSTQVLRQRWPRARVQGLDSSPEMIAAAKKAHPDQEWVLGDIAHWSPDAPYDVVFSNAVLHWLPDHATLVPHLLGQVAKGGALAIQMPSGVYARVRTFIREISEDAAWSSRMETARHALTMEDPTLYYDALALVARSVDIWETEYFHIMASPTAIVEWISSTGLRPFLEALHSSEERDRFVALLTERVSHAYTRRSDGRVLFPFRRLFVVAYT